MPTYVYRREDGTKFEIKQRITEDPLEECPETGQPVERIIAGSAGLIFKGDGFYITDYGKGDTGKQVDTTEANGREESNGSATDASSDGDSAATDSPSGSSTADGSGEATESA
ncbi:FmdB family zinc ribbon protein [Longibacter sp.]|uniref:FmdB family zinc ribbon protein n=1 Tax=Longibacter sp. TaxID=2045415 RepID=UPI003EBD5EA2